ncbi:MAG: hypothetical protein MR218_10825 [Eubacterium sp.]|nr:hypothetical protein [Eubacterium sp.]
MRSIKKEELRRAFGGMGFKLAVLTGLAIAFSHIVLVQVPLARENHMAKLGLLLYPLLEPYYASFYNIMMDLMNPEGYVYYLLLPVIATMPFSASFYLDRRSGYKMQVCQRTSQSQYLNAKYLACFLSGGAAVAIPLVVNYLFALMILPNIMPSAAMGTNTLSAQILFSNVYFIRPELYLLLYLAIDFLMGGLYACFGLFLSFFIRNAFVIWSAGFLIQLLINAASDSSQDTLYYSAVHWMRPGMGIAYPAVTLLWIVLLGAVPGVLYRFCAKKKEFL